MGKKWYDSRTLRVAAAEVLAAPVALYINMAEAGEPVAITLLISAALKVVLRYLTTQPLVK